MPVTISDIAARAQVAKSTVSLVLNGRAASAGISEKLAARVAAVAAQLNFRPNTAARATASGRFGSVALVLSTERMFANLPSLLLEGVHDVLAERDLHLTIAKLPDEKLTSEGYVPKILRQWMTDGLLINYQYHVPQRMVELIEQHRIPSVWINSRHQRDCVYADDFGAAQQATRHLLRLGHRRIAYVDYSHVLNDPAAHYSAQDRQAGYAAAMLEAALSPRVMHRPGEARIDRVQASMAWLSSPDRPTAVIGYGFSNTNPVHIAAASLGFSVPRDLSLIAFDDAPSNAAGPIMTTMMVPQGAIGAEATRMLLRKIERVGSVEGDQADCVAVPFEFEPGGTCAPAPG